MVVATGEVMAEVVVFETFASNSNKETVHLVQIADSDMKKVVGVVVEALVVMVVVLAVAHTTVAEFTAVAVEVAVTAEAV